MYVAVAEGNVFWTNWGGDSVMQWSHSGNTIITLASRQWGPIGIKSDGAHVFWVNRGDESGSTGQVMRVPVGGGQEPTAIATGQPKPLHVAIDDDFVYWTNEGGPVVRARKDSDGSEPLVTISSDAGMPWAIAVDDTRVYWTVQDRGGRVMSAPKGSTGEGPFTTLATEQGDPYEIAIDDTYVYWTTPTIGTVMRVAKTGGEVTTLVSGREVPRGIAADRTGVYWADMNSGRIMRALPNGVIGTVTDRQAAALGITIDADRVYWTNNSTLGTIVSAPK
ncbi:hypothetical protein WME98_09645 [Sorangium sp. So ce296]|uniref:hypothetical protein n=1 Tax=Sorangium sp. So ce296 TaxID=3133296 RepID=UPI003F5F3C6B